MSRPVHSAPYGQLAPVTGFDAVGVSMYRSVLAIVVFVLLALSAPPRGAAAQANPTWARGYSENGVSGCIEYVAAWSDGSFTSTPWACSGGPARIGTLTATRGYPQIAGNGCTEYVSQWSNGAYS